MASSGTVDRTIARELVLSISNDGNLYRSQIRPIILNLARKKIAGTYDAKKALILWGYLVDSGVKMYTREFGQIVVNKATKEAIARGLASEWQSELTYTVGQMKALKAAGKAWSLR